MTLAEWAAVAGVCALGAMSPGPSLAVVLRRTALGSRFQGLACAWGHALGIGTYAFLTIVGLGVLVARRPVIHAALALMGALYLAWLGCGAISSARSAGGEDGGVIAGTAGGRSAFGQGFLVAFLNPKVAVFFLALFSQFIGPVLAPLRHATLVLTALVIDGGWYTVAVLVVARPSWLVRYRRHAPVIEAMTGALLIAVAVVTVIGVLLEG